jgi:hypothetical protein
MIIDQLVGVHGDARELLAPHPISLVDEVCRLSNCGAQTSFSINHSLRGLIAILLLLGIWGTSTTAALSTNSSSVTNHVFVPATPEQFFYDRNGNLLSDGRFTNLWDLENRLVQSESLSSSPAASKRRLIFEYDYHGRRIRKKVFHWNTAGNNYFTTPASDLKFVYDGWNLLAELNATNNAVVRSYLWGLDMSGSLQDAGGVGGFLPKAKSRARVVVNSGTVQEPRSWPSTLKVSFEPDWGGHLRLQSAHRQSESNLTR